LLTFSLSLSLSLSHTHKHTLSLRKLDVRCQSVAGFRNPNLLLENLAILSENC
jgi:hypothetical protein